LAQPVTDSTYRATAKEQGFDGPPARPAGSLPAGGGHWPVPNFETYAAIINLTSRTLRFTFDEAMRDSRINALAMRSDPIIMSALRSRIVPTCQLDWTIEPHEETNPEEIEAAEKIKKIIKRTPRLQQLKRTFLEALFYGRYGAQLIYQWDYASGKKEMVIKNWAPVNGDKIIFKFDGSPGILVNSAFFQGSKESTERGMAHFFTPDEMEAFAWHEFEPEDADFFDGTMSGSIHGVGFRGRLYWFWWLRNNLTSILMDFMQKIGTGITIFFYEAGNEQSKTEVMNAAQAQAGNNVYLFPRNRDGTSQYSGPGIERVEVEMNGADMFLGLFNTLNAILRGYIMGEDLTTGTAPTGMGSGVAQAHESTAERRTKYDAVDLDHPMQMLTDVLYKYNCPGVIPGHFHHVVDKPDVSEFMEAAQFAFEMGMALDEDDTREKLGLTKPEAGHSTLSKVGEMQPAAVGAIPQGAPMSSPLIPGSSGGVEQGQPVEQDQSQPPEQSQIPANAIPQ
jgi:phage gp29-like protein